MRWEVIISYRVTADEHISVEYFIEELSELEDIVERGPDWNSISDIKVSLIRRANYSTIEEADAQ